jgi:lipopolysaccharide/colanic/teichoic acid biosynthesis glycosyltransferase
MSALLITLATPVMIGAAIAIFFERQGPVIFRQERVGRGGRTFTLLKFRSMRADAEHDGTARWASEKDHRVTAVGRFIRTLRIDELPQLWNVLKGEMSLIGPRPERPCFVATLSKEIPFYAIRHAVNPGITGWAQVRCEYGASVEDAKRKLQFDLYYVKNHSLVLDLLIAVETIRVVLSGKGAR